MAEYRVTWEIDIEADTHEEAAREALRIQRDPYSSATCFNVRNSKHWKDRKVIELDPIDEIDCYEEQQEAFRIVTEFWQAK